MDEHDRTECAVHLSFTGMTSIPEIENAIVTCERCPRLRAYCIEVALRKRRAFLGEDYWGRPVPGWGDPNASLLIVGLAPAAHGANRTGRMFTGDRSGDFLYAALHRAGLASQPFSHSMDDGLVLVDTFISNVVRCAPPENKPLPQEIGACRPYLLAEIHALSNVRAILALGKIAFDNVLTGLGEIGLTLPKPRPAFTHGGSCRLARYTLVASYHPSQRNTSTGLLTCEMMDEVLQSIVHFIK